MADAARGASADTPAPDPAPSAATSPGTPVVPSRTGGLDGLLTTGPIFHARLHGYDRLEVDNYVAWAESELVTALRETEHLLARYGACVAELEISRRLLAQTPQGRDLSQVSDRVRDILRLAADEATSMVACATEEAEQILAGARLEADERLRKAHRVKEAAAATADEMRELAERDRAEAAALLERSRAEAASMVGDATAERDRLAAEAAQAREQLTAVRAEAEDVRRQRDDALAALRRLTEQIEAALALASPGPSERFLLVGNSVVDRPVQSAPGVPVPS
jgi:cell division septum initiation protein DivIVA